LNKPKVARKVAKPQSRKFDNASEPCKGGVSQLGVKRSVSAAELRSEAPG